MHHIEALGYFPIAHTHAQGGGRREKGKEGGEERELIYNCAVDLFQYPLTTQ